MFDHLLDFDPEILTDAAPLLLEKASVAEVLGAQIETAAWLEGMGVPSASTVQKAAQAAVAGAAFTQMISDVPAAQIKGALLDARIPESVRTLVGMLSAYDWAFVERAQELRGYAVAAILKETDHPDARIRLKALDMLGRVTEIGLFTDRVVIHKENLSDAELDDHIRARLGRFMGRVSLVESPNDDVSDVVDVSTPPTVLQ
jgi:hypothetical protein